MMRLSDLSDDEIVGKLKGDGLALRTGPFIMRLYSPLALIHEGIATLYRDYPLGDEDGFSDFHVSVEPAPGLRHWFKPQVAFSFDGWSAFNTLPKAQALPLMEWGLNWCANVHGHHFLILHAAAIEKAGRVAILPAPPGSGKSTLCAGLVHRGWRLFSDELALISLVDGSVSPLVRPVSLKNKSIDVIKGFASDSVFSAPVHDTGKGTVALMKAPTDSVLRKHDRDAPAWVIFPRYEEGAEARFTARSKGQTCIEVGSNAINYSPLGQKGFMALTRLIDQCDCYDFVYGNLDQAEAAFAGLEPPA
ncbi:HprK-related kinase A [Magnetospira sp. QH-2]|uniref:HprK-related kinase A n=1 Tax=Magnetospira sp. (strain QH-2) TaxID=1288970 RepID=UPI0003E81B6B|nr:HprK-related kinase A [Magnetospira sp. QH-2]CCQ72874.1 Putative HPr protein kinase [Magnetospira sp. QH-2]